MIEMTLNSPAKHWECREICRRESGNYALKYCWKFFRLRDKLFSSTHPPTPSSWLHLLDWFPEQECIPLGCVPSAAVVGSGEGCVCLVGCLPRRGVCLGGVHPPVNWITDTCENITFPQLLLWTVGICNKGKAELTQLSGITTRL